jgi:hypothetical protein
MELIQITYGVTVSVDTIIFEFVNVISNSIVLFLQNIASVVGRDSAVGITTRYGLNGPGIESLWGARFSAPRQTGSGAHPASCTTGTDRTRHSVDHSPPTSAEVKESVELLSASPVGLHDLV